MFSTFIFLLFCLTKWAAGQTCPSKYQRFTQEHTFCREPNPHCGINIRGLHNGKKDISKILKIHNTLRSKVATGQEARAGGLPTASNMMQMFWDEELAAVAQKWAENCEFEHDCNECRAVENFAVGQNIGYWDYNCPGGKCSDDLNGKKPDWKSIIEMFYNEVKDYDKQYIATNAKPPSGAVVGHFTQVAWAETWRVGCGFVSYPLGDYMRNFFVCNYGPGGNTRGKSVYQPGAICSKCPLNACCGKACPGKNVFDGLCKMKKKNEAPEYPVSKEGMLFDCDFSKGNKDCSFKVEGEKPKIKKTLSGNIFSVQLKGGQQTEVFFKKGIKATSKYCLKPTLRKIPAQAGQSDLSELQLNITPKGKGSFSSALRLSGTGFVPFGMNMPDFYNDITFSIKFSVPPGGHEHILEMKEIQSYNGSC